MVSKEEEMLHRALPVAALAALLFAVTIAPTHASPPLETTYTVRSGDTLSAIGARCGVGWQQIASANGVTDPRSLRVGQSLRIPGSNGCSAAPAAPAAVSASGNVPAAPVARASAGFGYGVQAHMLGGDVQRSVDMTKGMGFNWVKQQVEWSHFEGSKGARDFGGLDPIVNAANGAGVKVLFSVVKAPDWARPGETDRSVAGPPGNPQDFADFLGAMAAHYRGRVHAYEVWNEQNLHYEWGNEPLSAARYVGLLCSAYRAIKAADPGAVVVSGALTPTGVNDGRVAIDDVNYLRQMYAAGLRGCSDAVGVHPSGYNNPATVGPGWTTAAEPGFKGHRSFYFRGTM
jgi:LysM repeat protein